MNFLIGGGVALLGIVVIGLAVHNTHGNAWQILTRP